MNNETLKEFRADRDAALLSMNREKIMAYLRKYGEYSEAASDAAFWIGVHKARTALRSLSMTARSDSKRWLLERGYKAEDDGDVPLLSPDSPND